MIQSSVKIVWNPTSDFDGGPPPMRITCEEIEFDGSWCVMRKVTYKNGATVDILGIAAHQVHYIEVTE